MVDRYGYNWEFLTVTGGGEDVDGNPIAGTKTWTDFACDVQTGVGGGGFVTNENGDKISVTYSLFTKVDTGLIRGGKVRDENGIEYTVLQMHPYKLNFEIWV
jgi:hypothetical protein